MKYFAYGSNMNEDRMKKRGINYGSRIFGILKDYKLVFNKKAQKGDFTYANIMPSPSDAVEGALYEFADEEIALLDKYEGFPKHYRKEELIIFDDSNTEQKAVVYIAQPAHIREGLFPKREYLDHILSGKDLLSESYLQNLKQIKTFEDFNPTTL